MRSHFLAVALVVAGWVASASTVQAQFYGNGYYPTRQYVVQPNNGIQYQGRLPNGIPVFNPWNMYNNNNYSGQIINGPIYPYYGYYGLYGNAYLGYGDGSGYTGLGNYSSVQRQPGRYIPVAPDLAVNPLTGTRLAPYRGIAETNQGTFFRIPGTGSLTAFGTFNPASGTYLNPVTGAVFNPGSGLILTP